MPAEPVTPWVIARVESVAPQGREVDPAHERGLVVDDDELLVVAVKGTLSCVERQRDPRAAGEFLSCPPHLAAVRMEERQRGAGPGEHPDVYSLGGFREQFTQRRALLLQPEGGIEVPARQVDVRARRANRVCDPRQRFSSVHEMPRRCSRNAARTTRCLPSRPRPDRQPPRCRAAGAAARGDRARRARSHHRLGRRGDWAKWEPRGRSAPRRRILTPSATSGIPTRSRRCRFR